MVQISVHSLPNALKLMVPSRKDLSECIKNKENFQRQSAQISETKMTRDLVFDWSRIAKETVYKSVTMTLLASAASLYYTPKRAD